MSNEQQAVDEGLKQLEGTGGTRAGGFAGRRPLVANLFADVDACQLDEEGHCVTCSDEARPARVLSVEQETGLAIVALGEAPTEIDVTLVDAVNPGEWVLVHGGVAIASLGEARNGAE
jgi:hydrogenase maturation factor